MIYPDIPVEKWVKGYDLEFNKDCTECGTTYSSMRPYLKKDYAGVACFCITCDENVYIYTPVSKEMIQFVKDKLTGEVK